MELRPNNDSTHWAAGEAYGERGSRRQEQDRGEKRAHPSVVSVPISSRDFLTAKNLHGVGAGGVSQLLAKMDGTPESVGSRVRRYLLEVSCSPSATHSPQEAIGGFLFGP